MQTKRDRRGALFLALLALTPASGWAQVALPYVPPETYQERRWLEGSKVTLCVWDVSPTAVIDRRIGEEIGNALLLETDFFEYESGVPHADDRFWEQIYIQLATSCDAVMGFALVSAIVPDWLTPTRPYYEGPYVLAVTNPDYTRLGDIPAGSLIGSMVYTTADLRLIEYLSLQPEGQAWRRFPFSDPALLIDYLERGTIEGALIWAPMLSDATDGDSSARGIRSVPIDPVTAAPTPIGMVLREHNVHLRGQIDRAIEILIEDGVIDAILQEAGLAPVSGQ